MTFSVFIAVAWITCLRLCRPLSPQKFEEELRGQQGNIDKIRYLAEEILQACHPNAVRFVKYYVTITQTRWEQVGNGDVMTMPLPISKTCSAMPIGVFN